MRFPRVPAIAWMVGSLSKAAAAVTSRQRDRGARGRACRQHAHEAMCTGFKIDGKMRGPDVRAEHVGAPRTVVIYNGAARTAALAPWCTASPPGCAETVAVIAAPRARRARRAAPRAAFA